MYSVSGRLGIKCRMKSLERDRWKTVSAYRALIKSKWIVGDYKAAIFACHSERTNKKVFPVVSTCVSIK